MIEEKLARFGLSNQSLRASGNRQAVIIPAYTEPPKRFTGNDVEVERRYGIPFGSTQPIFVIPHWREVPEWTQNNKSCQDFLRHLYPNGFEGGRPSLGKKARAHAARTAYVLYRWFRELAPAESIAEDLGLSMNSVQKMAAAIRDHGWPNADHYCCRTWRAKHPDPAEIAP